MVSVWFMPFSLERRKEGRKQSRDSDVSLDAASCFSLGPCRCWEMTSKLFPCARAQTLIFQSKSHYLIWLIKTFTFYTSVSMWRDVILIKPFTCDGSAVCLHVLVWDPAVFRYFVWVFGDKLFLHNRNKISHIFQSHNWSVIFLSNASHGILRNNS